METNKTIEKNFNGWKDAINNPPKKSGLYLCRVGKTFSEYMTYYKACRKEYQIWGLGREFPVTDMDVVLWMDIPDLGLCNRCKKEIAVMDYKEKLEPVCGICFGELEELDKDAYKSPLH